jgi:nucleoprotein TPR
VDADDAMADAFVETARAALENELADFKNSRASVDDEARNLRVRVQTLESDKRDTLDALDRKCNDYDKLQEEYTAAQHKNIATRRELGSLETRLQQTESAHSNAKFRAQSLEQELEMVKKNNEWLDAELATKVKEHQKFRKEKAAQVSSLNSDLEEAHSNTDMLRRSVDSLKERYEDVSKKAEERLAKIKDLQSSAASQEESFRQEINSQKRLAELYEKAMHTAKARVSEVEKIMEQELERFNVEIGHANSQVETERADKEEAEKRVAELEVEVERLEGELQAFASGDFMPAVAVTSPHGSVNGMSTPRRPASAMGIRATPGSPMPFSTPAAGRLEKHGMSVTRLYSDFNQMKAKYESEKRRSAKLEAAVEDMMKDMEERAPEMEELRNEHSRMEKDLVGMSKLLEETSKERDQAKKETRKVSGRIADFERETALLRKQLRDLSLQIQVLTVEIERRDAGIEDLNAQQNRIYEEIISGNLRLEDSHDTDALISQRLVVWRTVAELQQQNADLLRAVRELGAKMEQEEKQHVKDKEASDNEEIKRLEGVVERLQGEMKNVILKSQTFVRERDMFRRMLQNKGELARDVQPTSPAPPASDAGSTVLAEMQQNVAEALRSLQSQYDQFKTESLENQNTINEQNRKLSVERSELEINVARLNSQLEMASGGFGPRWMSVYKLTN